MMTCEECRERMIDAAYGEMEPEARASFDEHLASCAECPRRMAEMRSVLDFMSRRSRPEPDAAAWEAWDEGLRRRLSAAAAGAGEENKVVRFRPARVPAWAYGIAALFLVAVGTYLGRSWFGHPATGPAPQQTEFRTSVEPAAPDSLSRAAMEYLDRSRNVLLGVINTADSTGLPPAFEHQQRISRNLVRQASDLKSALDGPDQLQLRQLVEDLQVILVQLANIQVRPGVPVVELVRQGVDRKSILLKINLEQMKSKTGQPGRTDRNEKSHL